jgi:hypothetical protein
MEKRSPEQSNGKIPLEMFVCGGKKTNEAGACVDGAGGSPVPVGRDVGHSDGEDDQVMALVDNYKWSYT